MPIVTNRLLGTCSALKSVYELFIVYYPLLKSKLQEMGHYLSRSPLVARIEPDTKKCSVNIC